MVIVLRKMNKSFNWEDASAEIKVADSRQANDLVFAKEDASGGRESWNYRVVSHD